jgi:hypothetical protein
MHDKDVRRQVGSSVASLALRNPTLRSLVNHVPVAFLFSGTSSTSFASSLDHEHTFISPGWNVRGSLEAFAMIDEELDELEGNSTLIPTINLPTLSSITTLQP